MVTTLAPDATGPETRRTGHGLVLAGDRTREYRRAHRRTVLVRTLRYAFPATTIALLGVYALSVIEGAGVGTSLPEAAIRKILPQDLAMNNPRYEGFGKDGSSYVFTAKTAQQDLTKPNLIELNGISGLVSQADKTKTDISAKRGIFNQKESLLDLFEEISVSSAAGLKVQLTRATIMTKESILTSPEPVTVEFPNGAIRARTMTLRQKAKEVTFVEDVVASFTAPPPSAGASAAPTGATEQASLFQPSSGPVQITAKRLDVSDVTKVALFTGNVSAVQGEASLTTPELEVLYDGDGMISGQEKQEAQGAATFTAGAGKLSRIIAKSSVVMRRGATETVTSDNAEFDTANETATLLGNVVMTSGTDSRATSDRLDLDQRAETALLVGNVVITQGENELKGRRMLIDQKSGRAHLTAPPGLGAGPGRVTARLARVSNPDAEKTRKAKAKQEGGASTLGSFASDPSEPVSIEADELEVNDTARVAVFRGDVRAAQGAYSITSAELYAYYKGQAGLTSAMKPQDEPQQAAEISRIEAKRNVRVTSSDGQTASGDKAEFNAQKNTVTMTGNVILAKGQNMVRGTRLVIDMTSGETKIDTAPPKTVAKPSADGWSTEATESGMVESGGRASAVFFPQQLKDGEPSKPAPKAPAQLGDGWSATASPESPGLNDQPTRR